MTYLLDANVFIQAKNLHYGMDFCPAFWDWLLRENEAGNVFSIEGVRDELEAGGDELSTWATNQDDDFFLPYDQPMADALRTVSEWVNDQDYQPAAISAFLQDVDYYLISYALAHQHIVVTHEIPSDSVRKIKIPNVCIGVGVRHITTFQMLRTEQASFVLSD